MRLPNWYATAFGAVALLQCAAAQSTLTTTYYLERVQQTTPSAAYPTAYNGTAPKGTLAVPTASSSGAVVMQTGNAAVALGVSNAGVAAVAALVGLAVL